MRERGGGVFVNVGSTAAFGPRPASRSTTPPGRVHVMTKSMAVELAPDRIRVCGLAPVAGETPLLAMFMGEDTPEKRAAFKATVPLGRFSTLADIGNAALYLASDEVAFLTGVVLEVDGGRHLGGSPARRAFRGRIGKGDRTRRARSPRRRRRRSDNDARTRAAPRPSRTRPPARATACPESQYDRDERCGQRHHVTAREGVLVERSQERLEVEYAWNGRCRAAWRLIIG